MDINKLEELACAATPGVWTATAPVGQVEYEQSGGERYRWSVRCPSQPPASSHQLLALSSYNNNEQQDANFIAAASPAAVLELIALIRKQEQALTDSNLALMEQTELAEKLRKQAEALEAELRVARAACDAQGELSDTYRGIALAATPPAIEAPLALSEERIVMHAVNRFLGWKLPHNFSPDNGIQFHKPEEKQFWPIGTNLFTADEAKSMFQHCLTDVVTGCAIVKVERNRVWITKGVQSFMLAYEADTSEELHWYAEQLRTILMSNHQPAAAPAIQQEGAALDGLPPLPLVGHHGLALMADDSQVPAYSHHQMIDYARAALAAPAPVHQDKK